jgi:hypothetical protein
VRDCHTDPEGRERRDMEHVRVHQESHRAAEIADARGALGLEAGRDLAVGFVDGVFGDAGELVREVKGVQEEECVGEGLCDDGDEDTRPIGGG